MKLMKRFSCKPALLLVAALALLCGGWGFLVHRTTHQLAVYQLPGKLRPFFHAHMEEIVRTSVRPDQRRNFDSAEATRHFIDLEPFGDSAAWKMPAGWAEAVDRYSADSLYKYGYAPYWILVMKDRLTNAFRARNRDSILFLAADLGHYIADIHVPLHTSVNYDGQLTGQKGLHSLWESMVPELELNTYNLSSRRTARYLKDPGASVWGAIRQAHSLLPEVFGAERELGKLFHDSVKYRVQVRNGRESRSYSTAFARAYARRLGGTVNEQLLRTAALMADFWYTCWVDAGRPDLKELASAAYSKGEMKQLKKERKIYRRNELIEKGLLISRRGNNQE